MTCGIATTLWYLAFAIIAVAAVLITYRNDRLKYGLYFFFGALFGFLVFDLPSVSLQYYEYTPSCYYAMIGGVPITMFLAEGCAVVISIWLLERWVWPLIKGR